MDQSSQDVETELVDLSEVSLGMLRSTDPELLNESMSRLLEQVARPRLNIGNGGPPGRVD
ncbi:hypothetical protein KOI35_30695 [Actinoplanes bogorensis]|uniref:FXSXX-COOH protein n=1 Tax=Paractinoplanes bogorensis TaxID=1610840 RepID=A0ABS5YWR4_9ACTN|nr:hypothetical protein [Actinoplanes bogorensis]